MVQQGSFKGMPPGGISKGQPVYGSGGGGGSYSIREGTQVLPTGETVTLTTVAPQRLPGVYYRSNVSGTGGTQIQPTPTSVTPTQPQTFQQKAVGVAEKLGAFAAATSFPLVGIPSFGWTPKPVQEFRTEMYKSAYSYPIEHPVKTAAIAGISVGVAVGTPFVLAGAGAVGMGGLALAAYEGATYTLPVIYGAVKAKQITDAPTPKEAGKIVGEALTGEVAPAVLGGLAGQRAYLIGEGYIRTWGRTKVSTEKLVGTDVYTGQKRFYEAEGLTSAQSKALSGQQRLKIFQKEYAQLPGVKGQTAYSATAGIEPKQLFPVEKTGEGLGLFVAPKVSPAFLRLDYGGLNPYGKVVPFTGKPSVAAVTGQRYVLSPSSQLGTAFVRAVKPEIEAIMPVGTTATSISKQFFFSWKGVRVPIEVFKVGVGGTAGEAAAISAISASSFPTYTFSPIWQSLGASSLFGSSSVPPVTAPSYTSVPSTPSYPSYPSVPSKPTSPSYPSYPSVPSKPTSPSTPSVFSYPSVPTTPYISSRPSLPSFPSYPSAPYFPYVFLSKTKMIFDTRIGARKIKGKRRLKYTPDVKGLLLGIKGKEPKSKAQIALGLRPIPKGFKWSFSGGNI
jgi:hypothetical protein